MTRNDTSDLHATSQDECPECGASILGGRAGCQALWDKISARAYGDSDYAATRDLAFDTYCMQHLERYCRSAKSYAAHLTRLCCGLEYGGDPKIYAALQKWLNGTVAVEKPAAPSHRGRMSIADLRAADHAEEHTRLVHDWAQSVWAAYKVQHDIARTWIRAALSAQEMEKTKRTAG